MSLKKNSKVKKVVTSEGENVAVISTSDRTSFRYCRRKWEWSSPLRGSLSPIEQRHPLWFGSGMHHVLEDLHGYKLYKNTDDAVDDYIQATRKYHGEDNLPSSILDDAILMKRMLSHYQIGWLKLRGRDPLTTYYIKKVPQLEVTFEFEIPLEKKDLDAAGLDRVVYKGTLDRVTIDEDDYLWIQDYKNVSAFTSSERLELDSQIGAYLWAASYIYDVPVLGFIYTQFKKNGVEQPRVLKNGSISAAKDQNTSHSLYKAALSEKYGMGGPWPEDNMECLNHLASLEGEEMDKFIRRDRVTRSQKTMRSEAEKIIMEVTDMINPKLPIYPNPSFTCHIMCSFREPCIAKDRGEDFQFMLDTDYKKQAYHERNEWRKYLTVGSKTEKETVKVKGKV